MFRFDSPYVWAIARYTPSTQDVYGEYVQKFDKVSGARQFTDNAKEVFPIDAESRVHIGDVYLQDDAPLFLIKKGNDNGVSPITLNATLLDANGDFTWENEILPVATFAANKGRVTFNKPVNHQAVVVFTEEKVTGQKKIYAQNFATSVLGTVGFNVKSETKLYPNPSSGMFAINATSNIKSVEIYNMAGQSVYNNKGVNAWGTMVDASLWSNGVYMVQIQNQNGQSLAVKFVKAN